MSPRFMRLVPLALVVLIALGSGPMTAGGAAAQTPPRGPGMPNENIPDPRGLRDQRKIQYDKEMRVLREKKIDAATRRTVGRRNCKSDRACIAQVEETYKDEVRQIDNETTEVIATHRKALMEIQEMEREWKTYERLQREQRERGGFGK